MPPPDYSPWDMLAPADALAAHLALVEGLAGVPVIVARQKALKTEIDTAVAKARGAAILIALEGWRNLVPDGGDCHLELEHSVSIWTTPILRRGAIAESELLGLLVAAMQRHQPDPADCGARWETAGGRYVAHPQHRVYEFPAAYRATLPAPALSEPSEP